MLVMLEVEIFDFEVIWFWFYFEVCSFLDEIVCDGVQWMLQFVIEEEVQEFLLVYDNCCDEDGNCLVVCNGYLFVCDVVIGVGKLWVE